MCVKIQAGEFMMFGDALLHQVLNNLLSLSRDPALYLGISNRLWSLSNTMSRNTHGKVNNWMTGDGIILSRMNY